MVFGASAGSRVMVFQPLTIDAGVSRSTEARTPWALAYTRWSCSQASLSMPLTSTGAVG